MRKTRIWFAIGLAVGTALAVLVSVAPAGARPDVRIKAVNEGVIKGVVKGGRACRAGRTVVVKYEPLPGAGRVLAAAQKLGKTKSNRRGKWKLKGEFVPGRYIAVMKAKKSKRRLVRAREEDAIEEEEVAEEFDDELDRVGANRTRGCSKSRDSTRTNTGRRGISNAPACDNTKDDDGDNQADFEGAAGLPADSGCMDFEDTSEEELNKPLTLPGDGGGNANVYEFKPRFAAMPALPAEAYKVEFNPVLHSSNTVNHGGVPISGTPVCSGATMEIAAGVGAQAPTVSPMHGFPLPPPPDENHMRIVIDMQDAPGGDSCEGTIGIRIAVDTR